jgi:tape measure domain-containing protein
MANNVTFGVRLRADGAGFVGSVRLAEAEVQKLAKSIRAAGGEADQSGKRIAQSAEQSSKGFLAAAENASRLGRNIAGLAVGGYTLKQVADVVMGVGRAMLTAQINAEKFATTLRFATGGGQADVKREMDFVIGTAQRLGLEINSAGNAYGKLMAASRGTRMEGQQARQVFLAVSEAATVMGLSATEAEGALLAVQQMISKGTVQAEELRGQLGERLPGAFQIAARAMGVTTQELGKMLEQGQVVAADFLPKFAQQLRSELSGSVGEASKNVNVAVNRMATGWELLKREVAQSGIGKAIAGQLAIAGDAFDGIAEKMRKAREEGAGFWGSMWALAKGVAAFANPVNAFSYSAQGTQGRIAELQAEIEARTRIAADLRERGMHGLANTEVAKVIELTREYEKLAKAVKDAAGEMTNREDQASRVLDRENRRLTQEPAFRTLLGQSGTLAERAREARNRLNRDFGGLSAPDYRRAEELLMREVYGARNFTRGMASSGAEMERDAELTKRRVEVIKQAYKDGEMAARDYYRAIEAIEQHGLAQREASLERQLRLTEAEGQWTDKTADIVRLRAQLEAVRRERQAISERTEAEIAEHERRMGEERLGIAAEVAKRRGDLESAAVLEAVQKYGEKLKQAVANGEEGLAEEIRGLIVGAVDGAKFDSAKREAEALIAEFSRKLDEIKRAGGEEGGLMGALQVSKAASALRDKLVPQIKTLLETMRALAKDNPTLLKTVEELGNRLGDVTESSTEEWDNFVKRLDSTFRDGFVRMLEDGKAGWKSFTQSILNTFKTEVADQIYKAFVKPLVLRVIAGMGGTGAQITGGPGGGSFGSGFSLANNTWGGDGGMWGNAFAGAGMGMFVGSTSHALWGNQRNATGMNVGGTIGGMIGSIWGPIGAMIGSAIGSAIGSLFKDGGGPKEQGAWAGSWTGGGQFMGSLNGPRLVDITGDNQHSAEAERLTRTVAEGFFATLRNLGGTNNGLQLGLGFSADPRGTAPGFIHGVVRDSQGNVLYRNFNDDAPRDEGQFQQALDLETKRMILAAVQASELPDVVKRLVNSLNATTATAEEIDRVLGFAGNYATMSRLTAPGAARERADGFIAGSTAMGAYRAAGDALDEVVTSFNAGSASAEELVAATNAYVEAQANLLVQIHQVREAMRDMFADTRRNIELGGLTEQERYDYLRNEARRLTASLATMTDPEEIARVTQRINANLNEAFGMLSPEEQRRRRGEFLSSLDRLEDIVTTRLNAIGAEVEGDNANNPGSVLRRAADAMDDAAEKMINAATTLDGAADTIAANADHNVNVTVRVMDDRALVQVGP